MNNSNHPEENFNSFSEDELTQYIYNNVDSLTTVTFSALKNEIAIRKDLPNEVKMLIGNIQDLRNQNFISEIFPYLYSKNRKIKTVEDLIADLIKNEICEADITTLLQQLPKIIEINTARSNPKNSLKVVCILFCISIAVVSSTLFTTISVAIALTCASIGLYFAFDRNDCARINKLKINIELYLVRSKTIPKVKSKA